MYRPLHHFALLANGTGRSLATGDTPPANAYPAHGGVARPVTTGIDDPSHFHLLPHGPVTGISTQCFRHRTARRLATTDR
jgi:hypothetical protein